MLFSTPLPVSPPGRSAPIAFPDDPRVWKDVPLKRKLRLLRIKRVSHFKLIRHVTLICLREPLARCADVSTHDRRRHRTHHVFSDLRAPRGDAVTALWDMTVRSAVK